MDLGLYSGNFAVELHSGKSFHVAAGCSRIEGEFLELFNVVQPGFVQIVYAVRLIDVRAYWRCNAIHAVPATHAADFWDRPENIIQSAAEQVA